MIALANVPANKFYIADGHCVDLENDTTWARRRVTLRSRLAHDPGRGGEENARSRYEQAKMPEYAAA